MPTLIRGHRILDDAIAAVAALPDAQRGTVVIVEFEPHHGSDSRHLAALVSAAAKCDALRRAGLRVETRLVAGDLEAGAFLEWIRDWNERDDVVGVVLQRPFRAELQAVAPELRPDKDLDGVSSLAGVLSATAEAVCRIVGQLGAGEDAVAVVGARGAVGRDVIRGLARDGRELLRIDVGDDLRDVQRAPIVVSAVGQPWLLHSDHFRPWHRLIVDVGFTPLSLFPLVAHGDTNPAAWPEQAMVTPVPGGVGPLQIAVLLERIRTRATGRPAAEWDIAARALA